MAIYKAGSATTSQVSDGLMFRVPADSTSVLQLANNNFNSKSPGFQQMDGLIRSLDARYDMLQNQSDWELYAANIFGEWLLCANCQPDETGKKLYRQLNFNRALLQLAVVNVPDDDEEFFTPSDLNFEFVDATPNPPTGVFFFTTITAAGWWSAQVGMQMRNPKIRLKPGDELDAYHQGDPIWDFFWSIRSFGSVVACTFADDGAPGLKADIFVGS